MPPSTSASAPASWKRPGAGRTASASSMPRRLSRWCKSAAGQGWRMSWRHVRGHDVHVRAFSRAVERGRLAHAYLLTGAPGIGKHLFARELAKALLCEGRSDTLEPCDRCESCTLF